MKNLFPASARWLKPGRQAHPVNEPAAFAHRRTLAILLAVLGALLGGWLWRYGPAGGVELFGRPLAGLPLAVWQLGSTLGDARVLLIVALPFCRRHPRLLWALILASLFVWLLSRGLKHLVHLPRPLAPPDQALSGYDQKFSGSYSFPSGHTATIFSFISLWLAALPWRRSILLLLPGLFVACSRVMLGLHWPFDVIGGALIGLLAARAGILVAEHWHWGEQPVVHRRLAIVVLLLSMSLPFVDTGYPVTFPFRVALMIAGAAMLVAIHTTPFFSARREKPASQ
jgi:membrane-associated phospholipid phosphatase